MAAKAIIACDKLSRRSPELSTNFISSDCAQQHNMKLTLFSAGLFACLFSLVSATALTYKIGANEQACFYAAAEKKGSKIAFYFAVCFMRIALLTAPLTSCYRRSNLEARSILTIK